jgi:phosphotransferase system IIB component
MYFEKFSLHNSIKKVVFTENIFSFDHCATGCRLAEPSNLHAKKVVWFLILFVVYICSAYN